MQQGWKKVVAASVLTLAVAVPAGTGAASAATPAVKAQVYTVNWTQGGGFDWSTLLNGNLQSGGGYDWNSILEQIQKQVPQGGSGSGTVTQPSKPTQPTTPAQPTQPTQPTKPAQPSTPSTPSTGNDGSGSTTTDNSYAAQVVTLVNQERAKAGLPALKTDAALTNVAMAKAKDMYNNNYFDHNSPTYGSPFDMMKQFGVSFNSAGENIAKGQRSPQEVMTAWMNSPGHKANILKNGFTKIGVAYYNGVWVQEFTG